MIVEAPIPCLVSSWQQALDKYKPIMPLARPLNSLPLPQPASIYTK